VSLEGWGGRFHGAWWFPGSGSQYNLYLVTTQPNDKFSIIRLISMPLPVLAQIVLARLLGSVLSLARRR
jgi:hypothetical protein